MKTFLVIVFILILLLAFLFVSLAISGKKDLQEEKENKTYLTVENFFIIKDSPYANMLSEYTIHRQENELRFTRKGVGYTLFFLKLQVENPNTIKLVGWLRN